MQKNFLKFKNVRAGCFLLLFVLRSMFLCEFSVFSVVKLVRCCRMDFLVFCLVPKKGIFMSSPLTPILKIRAQTLAMIDELTQSPKPTYSVENQSVSWETYLKQLQTTVTWCDQQRAAADPFEIRTTAGT